MLVTDPACGEAAACRETYVRVNGSRVRVTVQNPEVGRPLLLINGIGASGDLFEPLRNQLGDRATIAFDAPGVGGSATPAFVPTMRRLARSVARVCEELKVGPVDVLGVSWGGLLAQELTRRRPGLVRRLVLVSTSTGWTGIPGELDAVALLWSPLRYFSADHLRGVAPTLYGPEIACQPHLLERQIELRMAHHPSWVGYAQQLHALVGWTSLPWLHHLQQPTLVVAGDQDRIVPAANSRVLAGRIANASLHISEGGGHLVHLTRPEEIAGVVGEFLDQ